jgi:hypothetical protein
MKYLLLPLLFSFPPSAPAVGTTPLISEDLPTEPTAELSALQGTIIRSTGAIEADVDAFRALLGNPVNGAVPGTQPTGHREINWDAVPAAVTNVLDFPAAFFNTNSPRGLVYDRSNRGLEVSDARFTDINPTYAAEFNPFSGAKMFSPLRTNKSEIRFFVPGSDTEAAVTGFGAVFSDVDVQGSAGLILIGDDGRTLARLVAPVRSDARGASFIGIVFPGTVISRVLVITGSGLLAADELDISQGGRHDLVVLDDFLYGEPKQTGP